VRTSGTRAQYAGKWWLYGRPRPEMRTALGGLSRFIATPAVSKHRIYVWVRSDVLCNQGTLVYARDDDYFFGVLQSRVHEIWARRKGTQLREAESGFRYTPTTCFETFSFPFPPREEPSNDARMESIASAARELVKKRDIWLNPPGASDQELKRRTLTKLYNQNPTWLKDVHRELDEAVLGAYGWPESSSDQEILTRLLKLNAERFAAEQAQKSLKFETEQAPKKVAASVTIAQKQKQKQKLKS
jgi:hypothetical protein